MKNERTVYTTRGCFPFILFSSCKRKNENGYNGSYFYFSFFVWGLEKRKMMLSDSFSFFYYEIEKRKTKNERMEYTRTVKFMQYTSTHFGLVTPNRHRSGSISAQVMTCCLTAPSHYINQCWLLWHSPQRAISQWVPSYRVMSLKTILIYFLFTAMSPRGR